MISAEHNPPQGRSFVIKEPRASGVVVRTRFDMPSFRLAEDPMISYENTVVREREWGRVVLALPWLLDSNLFLMAERWIRFCAGLDLGRAREAMRDRETTLFARMSLLESRCARDASEEEVVVDVYDELRFGVLAYCRALVVAMPLVVPWECVSYLDNPAGRISHRVHGSIATVSRPLREAHSITLPFRLVERASYDPPARVSSPMDVVVASHKVRYLVLWYNSAASPHR